MYRLVSQVVLRRLKQYFATAWGGTSEESHGWRKFKVKQRDSLTKEVMGFIFAALILFLHGDKVHFSFPPA